MVAAKKPRPSARPLDIPEDDWSQAVRRERVVRSLAVAGTNSRAAVKTAAGACWGSARPQVYRLIAAFRENPTTASLVVTRPGPKGARLLPCNVEQRIEQAINDIFISRERPTMAKLRRDLRKDCVDAGLTPPSRTAIQARVSARSLREMVRAREGCSAVRQRFVRFARACVRGHRSTSCRSITPRWTSNSLTTGHAPSWGVPGSHRCSMFSRDPFWVSIYRSTRHPPPASRWRSLRACCQKPNGLCATIWTWRGRCTASRALCTSITEQSFIRGPTSGAASNMGCASITGHLPRRASAGTSSASWAR